MSEIKVNKISPRTNCGTVTLGDSGDTFTIPAGVSITNSGTASGFGATGAVSWNTTVKTSGFTAVAGEGYFVNTTGGAVSVNLPAGTAGAVVGFKDYAGTFDTNAVTLVQNGSDKIGGSTVNATLGTEGQAVTLVFIDSTQGWLVTDSGLQDDASTAQFVAATGGNTVATSGNFKIHTFTSPGTFCVSNAGNSCGSNTVDYLVIAGGGGGGGGAVPSGTGSSGGGAGGYRESSGAASGCYSRSPLGACVSALPVSVQGYPIAVGGGGAAGAGGGPSPGCYPASTPGVNSTFSTIASAGGGGGAARSPGGGPPQQGSAGGSGGGTLYSNPVNAGNTPPVSPPQGNNGGSGGGGPNGGGGATAAGGTTSPGPVSGGAGGAGATSSINGTPTVRAGGGGGATSCGGSGGGAAGPGGGGAGGAGYQGAGAAATVNTGGGGGGSAGGNGNPTSAGGNGGSGIVIIRYKFQ
jgi:hypothetical protein